VSFLKLNGGAGVVLVALVLLATGSQAARAETTTLVCTTGEPSPTTVDLNEARGTVTLNFPAVQLPATTPPATLPARSESYAAEYDQKTITVETHDEMHKTYTINRLTGIIAVDGSYPTGGTFHGDWTCQVGKAKF